MEWRGLTACARRNIACISREIIDVTLFWNLWFLQNILELRLSPEIPSLIDWHLKIQNTTFLCIRFLPPILSPLHSTRAKSLLLSSRDSSPQELPGERLQKRVLQKSLVLSFFIKRFQKRDSNLLIEKESTKDFCNTLFCNRSSRISLVESLIFLQKRLQKRDSYAMGWLRFVGSIRFEVSFAKKPYKRDNILQKRPIIWSILPTVATPYKRLVYVKKDP